MIGFMRFAALLALGLAAAQDRNTQWREDIALTRTEFLARDLSYTDAERAQADAALQALAARVETLSDAEIVAGLAQAAAMADNAHTRAYILRNRGMWRRYPIRIWKFGEEWRVIAAQPAQAELVGARILSIGGVEIGAAERAMRPLFAGNDQWARYMATYTLTSPDALIGMGLMQGDGEAALDIERDGERRSVTLAPAPFERRERPEESWWFLSPAHPAAEGWTHALSETALPEALQGAAAHYRFERCEGDIAYLQFNRAQNAPDGETVRDFGARVLQVLADAPPRMLVVDLRFNTGGDLSLGAYFIRDVARSAFAQGPGNVAVIVGPNTFSAGITHVVQLRQEAPVTLVGTEPGDVLETWAEGGNVVLPHSGISMHYANRAHTYSAAPSGVPAELVWLDLNVENLNPDRAADWTWEAYRAGRDPYLEAATGAPLRCP
ncbi:MAG: hypothetical protein AB7P07_10165 [Hyphomonadaceae bacterium]